MSAPAPAYSNGESSSTHKNSSPQRNGPEGEPANGGFQPSNMMTVQPPKKEDLQRSYATIVGDDVGPKGAYGTMST